MVPALNQNYVLKQLMNPFLLEIHWQKPITPKPDLHPRICINVIRPY